MRFIYCQFKILQFLSSNNFKKVLSLSATYNAKVISKNIFGIFEGLKIREYSF